MPNSPVATGIGNLINMSVSMVVRGGDDGVYTCAATNSLGNDNHTISITVQCKLWMSMHAWLAVSEYACS